jgi:hypothetical protein
MKDIHPNRLLHHMPLRNLRAATRIRLHPEFAKDPALFARHHGVDLVGEVSPATSFRTNSGSNDKDESVKANIHLVQHKAIRLFTERDDDGDWIRSIDVNPAMLLHDDKNDLLIEPNLLLALSTLKAKVAPLLADPEDVRHIVPGLVDNGTHVSSWSEIESEVWIPGVDLRFLHDVSHPATGPAAGSTDKRLKLGDRGDCVIIIKPAKWTIAGNEGLREVHGVRVQLTLRGNALVNNFREVGSSSRMGNVMRLVSFRSSGVAKVHKATMSQLVGFYLPVPPEWPNMGKPMTTAKVIALLSKLMPIPPEELRAMYEARSTPSQSTQERLDDDIPAAIACLKPVPVSSLFNPDVHVSWVTDQRRPLASDIDPLIAAAYGPDAHSL